LARRKPMVLERKIWPVNARRTKDGPGGKGEPGWMRGSRGKFTDGPYSIGI
jgi:hypothetical protein